MLLKGTMQRSEHCVVLFFLLCRHLLLRSPAKINLVNTVVAEPTCQIAGVNVSLSYGQI